MSDQDTDLRTALMWQLAQMLPNRARDGSPLPMVPSPPKDLPLPAQAIFSRAALEPEDAHLRAHLKGLTPLNPYIRDSADAWMPLPRPVPPRE